MRTAIVLLTALLFQSAGVVSAQVRPFDPVGARHLAMGSVTAPLWRGAASTYHNPASVVWKTVSLGAGFQPVRFSKLPESYWFSFYNRESEYGVPISLIAHGWQTNLPKRRVQTHFVGMPLALNLTERTPGAATVKVAFEKAENGKWAVGVPLDFGFLARHPTGAVLGLVMRDVIIGGRRFESFQPRLDSGIAWDAGSFLIAAGTSWHRDEKWEDIRQRYRVGGEIGAQGVVMLRGGYIHEPQNWYATAGIGLKSEESGRYEVDYSAVYNREDKHISHYLQYILRY